MLRRHAGIWKDTSFYVSRHSDSLHNFPGEKKAKKSLAGFLRKKAKKNLAGLYGKSKKDIADTLRGK